ncbi:DUF3954 domain-containing protein [Lysinibacillus sphaericus]|uniref:DUF3954 domain-containing protein n=1 Tax=Lysinibacillus sphaericus TaxID=1421 RepID=UPI003D7F6456
MDQKMQQDGIYVVQDGNIIRFEPQIHGQDIFIWKNGQVLDVERTQRIRVKKSK